MSCQWRTSADIVATHGGQHELHQLLRPAEEHFVPRQVVGAEQAAHHADVRLEERNLLRGTPQLIV